MAIETIRVTFECGGCGRHFLVEMDPAIECAAFKTVYEMAEDCLRGGLDFYGFVGDKRTTKITGFTSLQGGQHLCPVCTTKVDEVLPEDKVETEQEVKDILKS